MGIVPFHEKIGCDFEPYPCRMHRYHVEHWTLGFISPRTSSGVAGEAANLDPKADDSHDGTCPGVRGTRLWPWVVDDPAEPSPLPAQIEEAHT